VILGKRNKARKINRILWGRELFIDGNVKKVVDFWCGEDTIDDVHDDVDGQLEFVKADIRFRASCRYVGTCW
jgi:hypothetical protein